MKIAERLRSQTEIDLAPTLFGGPEQSKWLRHLWASTRRRAKTADIEFTLPPGYAEVLYYNQHGHCQVTGIAFNLERYADAFVKRPFAPSIDRISSKGVYSPDNVRLVCVAVNFGMGQWGQEVFLRLARSAVALEATTAIDNIDANWRDRQLERIAAAEKILSLRPTEERAAEVRHIAGLKRALTHRASRSQDCGRKGP
jgi:hypothetical protein